MRSAECNRVDTMERTRGQSSYISRYVRENSWNAKGMRIHGAFAECEN